MNNKIFAVYDEESIRVYQAFSDKIADEAISNGTYGDSFSLIVVLLRVITTSCV